MCVYKFRATYIFILKKNDNKLPVGVFYNWYQSMDTIEEHDVNLLQIIFSLLANPSLTCSMIETIVYF